MKTITILSLVLFASLMPLKAICQDKSVKQPTPANINNDTTIVDPGSPRIINRPVCVLYDKEICQTYTPPIYVPLTEIARYGNHLDREDIKYSIYK